MPGSPRTPAIVSKTRWANTSQARSISRGPTRRHLPVEDADRLEVAVEHVADPGVAPAQHRVGAVGTLRLEPGEAALDERRAPAVGDRVVVPGPGPGQVAAQRRVPGGVGRRGTRTCDAASAIAVQPGERRDRAVLQPALLLGAGVVQPVVAEVVGQHVGRHRAVDPVHQEERRAEHVAGRLDPADLRHRHLGPLAGEPHRVVLVLRAGTTGRPARPRPRARPGRRTRPRVARPSRSRRRRAPASPTTCRWPRSRCAA